MQKLGNNYRNKIKPWKAICNVLHLFFILCVSCYTEVQLKSFQTEFFNILVIINYDLYHVILIEKLHTILE